MFICDRVSLNKYEYYIQDKHIEEIFKEANMRSIGSLILLEQHQQPIINHKWLRFSKKYNIHLTLTKEVSCFTPFSNKKIPFIFVSRNNREYNTIKRLSSLLCTQYIPFLSKEAFDYFKRLNFNIWYRKAEKVFDFFSEGIIGDAAKIPFKDDEIAFLSPFNSNSIVDYETFFSDANPNYTFSVEWKSQDIPIQNEIPLELGFLNDSNLNEKKRLFEEIKWLKETQHYKVFWLAFHLRKKISNVDFKGTFHNFLLSYKLGLIKRIPKNLIDLESNVSTEYIIFTHINYKNNILGAIEDLVQSLENQLKIPFSKEQILFSSVAEWFKKQYPDINLETLLLYKDLYDGKTKEEKISFFEDMKLYFLLNPGAEKAFKHSIWLSDKNVYRKVNQNHTFAIVDEGRYNSIGNHIDIGIDELKEHLCPVITLNFNKKNP